MPREKLTAETNDFATEVFKLFDKDGSNTIEIGEAEKHWTKFSKLNAKEFFAAVDVNGDKKIEYDEWIAFWEIVKAAGHDEEEIKEELTRVKNGDSWVGFDDLPIKKHTEEKKH